MSMKNWNFLNICWMDFPIDGAEEGVDVMQRFMDKKCSAADLKRFCRHVLSLELPASLENRVTLHCTVQPAIGNGCVKVHKDVSHYRYRIHINLLPFLRGTYTSHRMRLFYLYATIIHELKHIELLEKKNLGDYSELVAFWEEYRNFSRLRLLDGINLVLMGKNTRASQKKKYRVSAAEILCNLWAFQRSYLVLGSYLTEQERDTVETMIRSLSFLKEHLIISYSSGNHPYNLFPKMISEVQLVLKKDPGKRAEDLKPMQCLFLPDGQAKPVEQLFRERTDTNAMVTDGVLINWFICADMDFSGIFRKCPALKNHMEALANRYCAHAIGYLKDSGIGKVFLDDALLQDNGAMLVKNVDRLNKLIDRYAMAHTEGSIFALYHTGR